jgi:hypothetical protein
MLPRAWRRDNLIERKIKLQSLIFKMNNDEGWHKKNKWKKLMSGIVNFLNSWLELLN